MSKTGFWVSIVSILVLLAACQDRSAPEPSLTETDSRPSVNPEPTPETVVSDPDRWLGRWNGPEGTSLLLSKNGDRYVVQIQSLDGPANYEGVAAGDRIEFERGGRTQSIRAGNGKETGMKWLAEKKLCLIIEQGEGFCRE